MLSEKLRENSGKAWKAKNLVSKTFLFFLFIGLVFAQGSNHKIQVDYYGVLSSTGDANMLKMAQDMFYTQLNSIDGYIVNDYRESNAQYSSTSDFATTPKGHIVFFTEINEETSSDGSKKWNCVLKTIDPANGKSFFKDGTYESYYKILIGAKPTIEELLSNYKPNAAIPPPQSFEPVDSEGVPLSTENLAGTWTGEDDINKIVILRGSRGFVIFKNGATMNISVKINSIDNKIVEIAQVGKSNASFFPSIKREVALQAAPSAPPITWVLKLENESTMKGIKRTLVEKGNGTVPGEEKVTWTKRN